MTAATTAAAGRPSMLRRVAPAVGLFFLAPLVGEYLLGNVSIRLLPALPILALLYGGGALLVREVARRTGRGWPTILLLVAAYGMLEAGLIDQTLFNPPVLTGDPSDVPATYIPALGLAANNAMSFVGGHVIWSIGVPIAIVETFVPERRTTPWLGRFGLMVAGVLYLGGAALIFQDMTEHFLASPAQLTGAAIVAVSLIGAAFTVGRRSGPAIARRPPPPWLIGALAFVASGLFFARPEGWPSVAFGIVLVVAMIALVRRWSRSTGWGPAHRLALAGGALMTYAWGGFVLITLYGRTGVVDLVGQTCLAVGAVLLVAVAARSLRRLRGSA